MMISETATIHGRGSARHRWVSGLSAAERAAVIAGETVLVRDRNQHPSTAEYKQVTLWHDRNGRRRYGHRNYTGEEVTS